MKLKSSVAVLMVAVALSACGADSSSTSSVVVTTATSSSQGADSEPSSKPDNFVAKTVSGETFVLSNALAQKPVVLWFWAPG